MIEQLLVDEKLAAIIRELAKVMNTAPCYVADMFGVSPERIERLMYDRGQYQPFGDVALIDAIRRHYGQHAADLCKESWKEGE